MNKGWVLVMKAWKMALTLLDALANIAMDKPAAPRYSPMQAKMLYDEGRISNAEYGSAFYNDD